MTSPIDRYRRPGQGEMENQEKANMEDATNSKRILIVEDHPFIAESTRTLLSTMDSSLIVEICSSASAAIDEFNKHQEWFRIFLDIDVPGAQGLSLARQFTRLGMADKCAIISASANVQFRVEVEAMGMLGYIAKASPIEEFMAALHAVFRGEKSFPALDKATDMPKACRLTKRQEEILKLIQKGMTSQAIAEHLGVAYKTVDNHVSALFSALQVNNRAEAVSKSIELGY